MSFLDPVFFIFISAVILIYYVTPARFRWLVLLGASMFFYASWGFAGFPFIIGAAFIAWAAGLKMQSCYDRSAAKAGPGQSRAGDGDVSGLQWISLDDQDEETDRGREKKPAAKSPSDARRICRRYLTAAMLFIIGTLIVTKILNLLTPGLITVLGISYYTLSLAGYLADVYWKKEKAERNFFRLLLFTMFFPKILQGPISKHRDLGKQLDTPLRPGYHDLTYGLQLMVWGYFKKLVIADRLAIIVNNVFSGYQNKSGAMLLVAAVFGAFQLYCDFSGCMDIAAGICEAMGIRLERNFNHPFFSETAAEFWRRWHITLGAWFRDYVYMPLAVSPGLIKLSGKTRKKLGRRAGKAIVTVIPLAVVWLLTGLWHGTGYNYLVWGAFWGVIIIISTVFEPEFKKLNRLLHIPDQSAAWRHVRMIRTFFVFVVSRIITIPDSLRDSAAIFRRIFTHFQPWTLFDGTIYTLGVSQNKFIAIVAGILVLWGVSRHEEKKGSVRDAVAAQPIVIRWIVYYGLLLAVIIWGIYGPGYDSSAFIYMQY